MQVEINQLERRYEGLRIREAAGLGRLVSSLAEHGQRIPVLVVPAAAADRYVLIDGYRRLFALERLGRDLIEAATLEIAESEALIVSQKLDGRRRLSAIEEGWFLRELVEGHGLSPKELALRLERSPSWVSRRLALISILPAPAQDAVRRGRIRPQVAMKILVPLARANESACQRLVENLGPEPWSVREMERLYRAFRQGGAAERERILEYPELFRKASEELGDGGNSETNRIADDLGVLFGVSTRLRGRLDDGELAALDGAGRRRAARAWGRARRALSELEMQMEEELARLGDENSDLAPSPRGPRDPDHRPGAGDLAQRGAPGAS